MHRLIANEHVPRAGFQTAPLTAFTGLGVEIAGEFFTNRVGFRVPVPTFHVGNNAFKSVCPPPRPSSVRTQITEVDLFFSAAVKNDVTDFL